MDNNNKAIKWQGDHPSGSTTACEKTNKRHNNGTSSTQQERAGRQSRSPSKGGKERGRPSTGNITTVTKQGQNNKNWDEGLDPRITRERYELFIHENFPDVKLEEEFEDTLMQIHNGGFKRRIITDQAEWRNIILRSKHRRGWLEAEDYIQFGRRRDQQ